MISEALVGENIGNYTLVGYDETDDGKKYTAEFEVYKLQNIAQSITSSRVVNMHLQARLASLWKQ